MLQLHLHRDLISDPGACERLVAVAGGALRLQAFDVEILPRVAQAVHLMTRGAEEVRYMRREQEKDRKRKGGRGGAKEKY